MGQRLNRVPGANGKGAPLDLDLDLTRAIGRKPARVEGEVLRELTESDLALLATERGIQPTHIARLSDRHHSLARALASGLSVSDACAITGYTASRVSILRGDPSFEELIAFYQAGKAEAVHDLGQKLTETAKDAVQLIQDRMETSGDEIPLDTLVDIAKFGADRSGHGPQSKSTQVNIHVGLAGRLAAARQRVVDVTPEKDKK